MPELSRERAITFHIEDVTVALPQEETLAAWLHQIASDHESQIEELAYILCSDAYILDINKTHLGHDYYTDIITFPYRQGSVIYSDIFISVERVRDNAQQYADGDADRELLRVMAHGLLHMLGYGDKTDEEAAVMRSQEDTAIARFHAMIDQA